MTDGTYMLASYNCDVCGVTMPQIADQAGQGYLGWSATFVKSEALRHIGTERHQSKIAEKEAAQ